MHTIGRHTLQFLLVLFLHHTHACVERTQPCSSPSVQRPRVIPKSGPPAHTGPCGVGRWLIHLQNQPPPHPQGQLHLLPLASLATPPLGLIRNVRRSRSPEKRLAGCPSLSHTHVHTHLLCSKFIVFFCQLREAGAAAGWNACKQAVGSPPGRGKLEREDWGEGVGTERGGEKGKEGEAEEAGDPERNR